MKSKSNTPNVSMPRKRMRRAENEGDLQAQLDAILAADESESDLMQMLDMHRDALVALELRLQGATFAEDDTRVKELTKLRDEEKQYTDYFRKQLAEGFPKAKIAPFDPRETEQHVTLAECGTFAQLRRSAKSQYRASQFTGNKDHQATAQAVADKAQKYLDFYKTRLDKLVKLSRKQDSTRAT